jgi:hypothetical protein
MYVSVVRRWSESSQNCSLPWRPPKIYKCRFSGARSGRQRYQAVLQARAPIANRRAASQAAPQACLSRVRPSFPISLSPTQSSDGAYTRPQNISGHENVMIEFIMPLFGWDRALAAATNINSL